MIDAEPQLMDLKGVDDKVIDHSDQLSKADDVIRDHVKKIERLLKSSEQH